LQRQRLALRERALADGVCGELLILEKSAIRHTQVGVGLGARNPY